MPKQIVAVLLLNLSSLPQRLASSMVVIVGVGVAVAVLMTVLGMAEGFRQMMAGTGRADRALVLAPAAFSESSSLLARDIVVALADSPGIKLGEDGKPLVSPEVVLLVELTKRSTGKRVNVTLRGVRSDAVDVRPEIRIIEGRMFNPAVREIIVGDLAQAEFAGIDIGSSVKLNGVTWQVVGRFVTQGGSMGSELIGDAETVLTAYRRNHFQSVTAQLVSAQSFSQFKDAVTTNPLLNVEVRRESDYYAEQSKDFAVLLKYIAYGVGGLMGFGAMFGALNTMYSAVRSRSRETATLRALGFPRSAIAISLMVEALLLACVGAGAGAVAAWLLFGNATASTVAGAGTQIIYSFELTADALRAGVAGACFIALVGAAFPVVSALRAPIPPALQ